MTVRQELDNQ